MGRRIPRVAALVAVILGGCAQAAPSDAGPRPLDVAVRARAIAPGEPLRVVVDSPVALREVRGSFLGEAITFARRGELGAGAERWSGWTMVGLADASGPTQLELLAVTADGGELAAVRMLEIEPREFPEEHLRVESKYVAPPDDVAQRLARERELTAAVYRTRSEMPRTASSFVAPVDGPPTSVFGLRRVFNGEPRSPHPGLDLRAATGTPVVCSGDGIVVLARDLYYSGNTVIVDHGGGLFTIYAHLSSIEVEEGRTIGAGARLGRSGATGRVTGPHLHWGAKIGDRPFDPRALLDPALFE